MKTPCLSLGLALLLATSTAGDVLANATAEREEDALTAVDDEYVAEASQKAPAPALRLAPAAPAPSPRLPPARGGRRFPSTSPPAFDRLYTFMSLRR